MSNMTSTQFDEARALCVALFDYLEKHGSSPDEFDELYTALDLLRDVFREYDEANGQFGVGA